MRDILYAPWRKHYVQCKKIKECEFCYISKHEKEANKLNVLYKDKYCFIVMNKYPYTPGHFMIIPHIHINSLESLDPVIWQHMMLKAQQGVLLLKKHFKANGVNLGMNLGSAGGAGIAEHIHFHILPRWYGDSNFLTSIGKTRVFSLDFKAIYNEFLQVSPNYFY